VLVASCESTRKLTYLNDIRETGEDSLFTRNLEPYRLQPADILYIRIITQNEEMNQLFNPLMGTGANQQARVGNMYYNGYTVNDSGFIDMPILDTIYVNGLTTGQARERVTRRAVEYLKEPQVIVKLANKRFTLLGEVNGKGVHEVQDDRLNILEALAYGGGISYNGDREHVLILRPTEKGTHTFRVDVTNRDLITSKRYYIQPNDIIFVPPLKTTLFRERTTDYMFMLSTFTSVVSTVFLILNFTK
jgi:polysaccharide export outer membrane protein